MLRVLTLATLFPNSARPTFGNFVERQTLGLAAIPGVDLRVVAPVGLPPWPGRYHPRYRAMARLPKAEVWKGLNVYRPRFPILPGPAGRWNARSLARALAPLLTRLRSDFPFDVIDAEFFWPDGIAAVALGQRFRCPVSIKARGSDILFWIRQPGVAPQIVAAGRAADGLLAVSGALRDAMVEAGLPAERIQVHYTGIDRTLFRPGGRAAAKARIGLDGPLIVTPAALVPGKGHSLALEALALLPGATLLLAGEGPERHAIERQIRELGLGERTRLLGALPHKAVAELLSAADVMLLTSRSEGLANVWVEALASGTPVVTLDVGGAREVIDRPTAGRLVAPDPVSVARGLAEILSDPPSPDRVSEAADRFSWETNAEALLAHLSRLAAAS